jgi:hypothetical protein
LKEAVGACFKILLYNLLGETEEKHENPESWCPGFEPLLWSLDCELGMLTVTIWRASEKGI